MPERFLLQILRSLVAHRVLESTRGVEGGYMLGRPPKEISLLDVIEAIDGPLLPIVPAGGGLHAQSRTKLKRALAAVTAATCRELGAVKLSHLLPDRRKRTAPGRKAPARGARSGRLRKVHH